MWNRLRHHYKFAPRLNLTSLIKYQDILKMENEYIRALEGQYYIRTFTIFAVANKAYPRGLVEQAYYDNLRNQYIMKHFWKDDSSNDANL